MLVLKSREYIMNASNYSVEDYNASTDINGTIAFNDVFKNPFQVPVARILFIICYATVFASCILGNCMVLFAIATNRRLRSMTNFFLANLAVADFWVGIFCVLPNLSTFLSQKWILGKAMCKIYYYVWNVSYTASIVILTVIAVERYIAVIYPLKAKYFRSKQKLLLSLVIIWTIALVYNIPYLLFYDILSITFLNIEYCYIDPYNLSGIKGLCLANFVVWYIVPLFIIGVLYFRISIKMWNASLASIRIRKYSSNVNGKCHSQTSQFTNMSEELPSDSRGQNLDSKKIHDPINVDKAGKRKDSSGNSSQLIQEVYDFEDSRSDKEDERCLTFKERSRMTKPNISTQSVYHERRKVIRLLIVVVVAFSTCVLPHHIKVLSHFWNIIRIPNNVAVYFSPISFLILFLNSCLNPILYALFSTNFRKAFKESLKCVG